MKSMYYSLFGAILIQFSLSCLLPVDVNAAATNKGKAKTELETRIDFGNSYIVGQTIKSGAVYLLQRKKSEIKSMLQYRKDFRKEILEDFHVNDMKIKEKEIQ